MSVQKIMIIAGERSGDIHAGGLIKCMKKLSPGLEVFGVGGEEMQSAGMRLLSDVTGKAIVGFVEVIKHIGELRKLFKLVVQTIKEECPEAIILVDFPGFNMRVAKFAKKKGLKVFYYISPQVWAWGKGRVKQIAKNVEKMLVILPFEEKFYRDRGVRVLFVGHPLLDIHNPGRAREEIFKEMTGGGASFLVGLLPGSRLQEVKNHLPVMLESARIIYSKKPRVHFVIGCAKTVPEDSVKGSLEIAKGLCKEDIPIKVVYDRTREIMKSADTLIVASGTATLESAIFHTPMVVIYRVSFLTYLILKVLVRIPHVAMVNVLAGKKVVPEFVQYDVTAENVSREVLRLLDSPEEREIQRENLMKISATLGGPGASERAARAILSEIGAGI